jgi:hypothetical protein
LHHYHLPLNLWQCAVQVAALTRNVTSSGEESPYEQFFKIKPDISHFKIFGCLAHVLVAQERRTSRFETVDDTGILVGYGTYSKAWKILVSTEAGFVISDTQDVAFDESRTCSKLCAELREYPDADVKPAAGSQFIDLVVPPLSKAPLASYHSDDDTSESTPPYALVPHVSTFENTSSLLGRSADEG